MRDIEYDVVVYIFIFTRKIEIESWKLKVRLNSKEVKLGPTKK